MGGDRKEKKDEVYDSQRKVKESNNFFAFGILGLDYYVAITEYADFLITMVPLFLFLN